MSEHEILHALVRLVTVVLATKLSFRLFPPTRP